MESDETLEVDVHVRDHTPVDESLEGSIAVVLLSLW